MAGDKITTLYLLRHGQTEDNALRVIQGQNDSPLTQEGIIDTRNRAKKLKSVFFDAIYCSDIKRAKKSLEILLGELDRKIEVNYCANIREIDFGRFTGSRIEDIKDVILFHKKHLSKYYPGGESGDSFGRRVINFVESVLGKYEGKTLLFMTHYGVIETILKRYVKKLDNKLNANNYDIGVLYISSEDTKFKWI